MFAAPQYRRESQRGAAIGETSGEGIDCGAVVGSLSHSLLCGAAISAELERGVRGRGVALLSVSPSLIPPAGPSYLLSLFSLFFSHASSLYCDIYLRFEITRFLLRWPISQQFRVANGISSKTATVPWTLPPLPIHPSVRNAFLPRPLLWSSVHSNRPRITGRAIARPPQQGRLSSAFSASSNIGVACFSSHANFPTSFQILQ